MTEPRAYHNPRFTDPDGAAALQSLPSLRQTERKRILASGREREWKNMSATVYDALNGTHGKLRSLDLPADVVPDSPDFTEDLANETTTELDPTRQARHPPTFATNGHAHGVAATNGSSATAAGLLRERYLLETQLGNGGTAIVFRAVDQRRVAGDVDDGRRVAIKLLRPELRDRPHSVARLQREFRQTQAVAHPNIVRFLDLDCDGDAWFIVMELLSGETLRPLLRRVAPSGLPLAEASRIGCAVGDALVHAHSRSVTHGDVKPGNIFLTDDGGVRLFDFGVAPESLAKNPDNTGVPVAAAATRAYASPEMLAGEAPEPRDDVFSLACVIHEMVSGRHPYGRRGVDRARDAAIVPERLVALGRERASAIASALSLVRANRPTMGELVRVLKAEAAPALPGAAEPAVPGLVAPRIVAPRIVAPRIVAPRIAIPPVETAPVASPVPTTALPSTPVPKRSSISLRVGLAAGAALVLGILIGRLDPGSAPAVATMPTSTRSPEPQLPPQALPQSTIPVAQDSAADPAAEPPGLAAAADPALAARGAPGLVFFDVPRMEVSKRAVVAAIPLRHLNRARRPVSVHWRTIDGTARAGQDYGGPPTGVESFVEGNSFRILYVPIVPDANATGDRSFTVELVGVSGGADLGPTAQIEVKILGES
jgi:serine/threonine protein kinase